MNRDREVERALRSFLPSRKNRRLLIAGALVLAAIVALLISGYFLIAQRGDDSPGTSPSPGPTEPRLEIEQAYLRFWNVYAQAALELRPELMEEVATDQALEGLTTQIEEQRSKNQPVRIRVEHNYQIIYPIPETPETASVDDRYINHSVRLDPQTKEPVEPDPNTPTHDTYTLKKVDGKWKVAEIIEHR